MMRILERLGNQIMNLVARAVVQLVDDSTKVQILQLAVLTDETRAGCERFQEFGFTSVPLAGAEAVVLFVGGDRAHPMVVAVDDRRYRKRGLQPGECAVYNAAGTYLLLTASNAIEVNAPINLVSGAVLNVGGQQIVGARGAAVADATATTVSVQTQLNLLLARCRAHGLIA